MTRPLQPARPRAHRGVAALTVVMVLFFVMALVAAYTNRNLVFEQRISANSFRSNRALEAADAGIEWAAAMLNAGRVDDNCRPTLDPAFGDFKSRYLVDSTIETNGEGGFSLPWGANLANRVYPSCIIVNGAINCICPTVGAQAPDMALPADGIGSAFRITFILPGNAIRPGAMQFSSLGCANPGAGNTSCFAQTDTPPAVDAVSGALTTVGLVRALPVLPKAALTAGTTVNAPAADLLLSNGDFSSGLTVQAGGVITQTGTSRFEGPPGSGSDGRVESDLAVAALAGAPNEAWFRALFGMDSVNYQRQPAVVRINCLAGGGCNLADLANTLAAYPRNPIWVDGNLDINTAAALGSPTEPRMIIVTGTLTVSANATLRGFFHANLVNWTSQAMVEGALVSATSFNATAGSTAIVVYNKPLLDIIRLRYGSFVRAPGGWNLF